MSSKLKKTVPTENQEQRALVKWIKLQPKLRELILKIDNEGERTQAQGWHAKMMGLMPGASDLFLAVPVISPRFKHGFRAGLWIEMKRAMRYPPSKRMTDTWLAQETFQERMKSVGYAAKFCYGWEDGVQAIERYLAGDEP